MMILLISIGSRARLLLALRLIVAWIRVLPQDEMEQYARSKTYVVEEPKASERQPSALRD